jgi:uncharacterized protein DUF5076
MRVLVIPPAAQRDENAIQMLSVWIAEQGMHCTLNVGMWHEAGRNEPNAWGVLLADVVRHVGNAIQEERGLPAEETTQAIVAALLSELESPTSNATGNFSPGHS